MRYVYLLRRILAAAVIPMALYFLVSPQYWIGQISTTILGGLVSLIILLAKQNDIWQIVRAAVTCWACVSVFTFLLEPIGYPPDAILRNTIVGETVGMIVAIRIIARYKH